MLTRDFLAKQMQQIARGIRENIAQLHREKLQLQTKAAEIETALHNAQASLLRCTELPEAFWSNTNCLDCWVNKGTILPLKAVGGGSNTVEIMRCAECNEEYSIPI